MRTSLSSVARRLLVVALGALLPSVAHASAIQLFVPFHGTTVTYDQTDDLLTSPLALTTADNVVTFTLAQGDWRRADQGVNFFGDFDPGTHLLYTNNNNFLSFDGVHTVGGGGSGPIDIEFAAPVRRVELRAETDIVGPETFTFSVYDGPSLLGTFTASDISGQRGDDQFALLLAALTTGGDEITRLHISSVGFQGGVSHPNRFVIGPVTYSVPEPATVSLLLVGAAAGVWRRRTCA